MAFKKTPDWDTEKSTFKWQIYLANGKHFPGYSKRKDGIEPKDKCKLLYRILRRLRKQQDKYPDYLQGYFTPGLVDRIDLYKRTGLGEYEQKLVTFYPTAYKLGYNSDFNNKAEIQNYLNEFYSELKNGKLIPSDTTKDQLYIGIGYSKKIDERKFFSLDRFRFKNVVELNEWIGKALTEGHQFELLNHFRNQYIDQNLSGS
jgi:hypothetical protein